MDNTWLGFLPPFFQGLIVSTGLGLIIGLEREHQQQTETRHFAGLRTFPLLAILGFLAGFISDQYLPWFLPAVSLGLFLLVVTAYYIQAQASNFGMTTELAATTAYALGALVAFGYPAEGLATAVLVTVLLSLKEEFHWFVKQITHLELAAFIKFFVVAVLLLALLPDAYFGPDDLLNYRELGWIIVLVSSISFTGYLLLKFTGPERGILLTALLGGLFSSTMIAWVFGARSRETPELSRPLSAGILLASSVMYIRMLLLTLLFSPPVSWQLLPPCLIMLALSLVAVWYRARARKGAESAAHLSLGNPLDLKNALFFGLLYIAVSLFMYYSRQWFGESGSYLSGIISGIADMDAITISTAKWAKQATAYEYGANMVMVAALSNSVFKAAVSILRGHRSMRGYLAAGFGSVMLIGLFWLAVRLW